MLVFGLLESSCQLCPGIVQFSSDGQILAGFTLRLDMRTIIAFVVAVCVCGAEPKRPVEDIRKEIEAVKKKLAALEAELAAAGGETKWLNEDTIEIGSIGTFGSKGDPSKVRVEKILSEDEFTVRISGGGVSMIAFVRDYPTKELVNGKLMKESVWKVAGRSNISGEIIYRIEPMK